MNKTELFNEILDILQSIKNDKEILEKIHTFLIDEIWKEPEPDQIPEKYKQTVSIIAENNLCGLVCFLNLNTLEIEDAPANMFVDPEEYELTTGLSLESVEFKHKHWEKFITIEPMDSNESFFIMEAFTNGMNDNDFQQKLFEVLNRKNPFANFKTLIDNSPYREDWFNYRKSWYENYVWQLISINLEFDDE